MLGASENDGAGHDADDPILLVLRQALAYTRTPGERVKVLLATELRQHLLAEALENMAQISRLQQALEQARRGWQQSKQAHEADTARVQQIRDGGGGMAAMLLRQRDRRQAEEAMGFSAMMADRAQGDVDSRARELEALRERAASTEERLGTELRMACLACIDVLLRLPKENRAGVAALQLDAEPQSSDPRPRPPPPPSQRPFSITSDASPETLALLGRFQAQVPRAFLVPIHIAPDAAGSGQSVETHVRQAVLGSPLWTGLRGMLLQLFPQITHADLEHGHPRFGADAYLHIRGTQEARIPISVAGAFSLPPGEHRPAAGCNQRAIVESLALWAERCDPRRIESAVKRLVMLVSAERLSKNAGMLVCAEGLLFVRRTSMQGVQISRLHGYDVRRQGGLHPVAAIGFFVQQILTTRTLTLSPPVIL
ncbi:hypothetical protein GGI07_005452 [Coemansia sp. Benny D115]|nr:hypothetical protein GGI07_005452 [Coemansia sp. Benny D115]